MAKKLSEMSLEELWQLFPIFLTEHQNYWKDWYAEEENILKKLLPQAERISHIGSTAVSSIWAKPIIDILVEVPLGCDLSSIKDVLVKNGYICMNQNLHRISFNKGYTENGFAEKVFHLHLRYSGDNEELYFRDYLMEFPELAGEYEKMKLELWKEYEHNRDGYTNAKADFVRKYTQEAKSIYGNKYEQKMGGTKMYCILVAGMPASGKSTIAGYLAENLQIPMISKDGIKEILFDEIGFKSREEKNKLGGASMEIMYHIAEQIMQIGGAFILESNFEHASKEGLLQLLDKYGYTAVTVRLTGDYRKIYERFAERDRSPERHRGHVVNDCYPEIEGAKKENPTMLKYEGFLYGIERRGFDSFVANGPCIVIDTTEFSNVNMEEILEQVRHAIYTL